MKSKFAWLDCSDKERENALQVVRQLQSPEARDELGIGVVRDVLSDILFPGTSTIQTRLRYFLFVPWIFQQLNEAVRQGSVDDPAAFGHWVRLSRQLCRVEKLLLQKTGGRPIHPGYEPGESDCRNERRKEQPAGITQFAR